MQTVKVVLQERAYNPRTDVPTLTVTAPVGFFKIAIDPSMKRIWDNRIIIGEIRRSQGKIIRVELTARDGIKYITLRDFNCATNGEMFPGKGGITLPIAVPINNGENIITPFVELLELFNQAFKESESFEIFNEKNMVYGRLTLEQEFKKLQKKIRLATMRKIEKEELDYEEEKKRYVEIYGSGDK